MDSPEYEKTRDKDESGFSEKQIDIDLEIGNFKKPGSKKIIFQKKRKK